MRLEIQGSRTPLGLIERKKGPNWLQERKLHGKQMTLSSINGSIVIGDWKIVPVAH
jgi:hypothetical protein